MVFRSYMVLIVGLCLLLQIESASTPPVWVPSSYFKAGGVTFVFGSGTSTSQNTTIVYSSAIVNPSLKKPTLGITDLGYVIATGRIYLLIMIETFTTTQMTFSVIVNLRSCLTSLKLTYMALDNLFTPAFSMNYFFPNVNQNGTGISAQYYVNFTSSTGVTLNTSHENVLLPFMHYIDLTSYDGTVDINLNFSLLNASFYTVIISSTSNMNLEYAGFSRLIFDKTAIEAMGNDYFHYGIVGAVSSAALGTIIPPDILPANLYYGLHSFTLAAPASCLNFTSTYGISSGALDYLREGAYIFSKMKFSYMHHKTRTCPAGFPYYNITEMLCYDVCSARWFGDTGSMTCKTCLYDCYGCNSSTTCTTCNATTDFRTLSGSRCAPMPGYYDNGTNSSTASPCTSPCATCTTFATYCLSCVSGYYLNSTSHTCIACSSAIPNCNTCSSATYCTLCASGASGSTCTSCSSSEYLNATSNTCISCATAIAHCQTCTSSTSCSLCQTTFTLTSPTSCICSSSQYLSSNLCYSCASAISHCSTCTSATGCTACDTSFVLVNGSYCGCNTTSYLDTGLSSCVLCSNTYTYCATCTSSVCLTCLTSFSLVNGSCVCSSGYYADAGTSSCLSCTTINHCLTCTSSSNCLTCSAGYDPDPSGQCILQPCQVSNCYSCNPSNYSQCTTCDNGFSPTTTHAACQVVCGDGYLSSTERCDDGNTIDGDGCSGVCSVQDGFSCVEQYINTTYSFSACYYSAAITFDLVWIRKLEGTNSLKFAFYLHNVIQQWNTVDFASILSIDTVDPTTNFTQGKTSLFVSSYVATYESSRNRFYVTVDYFGLDLQSQWIAFSLFPYSHNTYPAFTPPPNVEFDTPTIRRIFPVVANNNQNSQVYSSAEYSAYSVSVTTTYVVVGVGVFAVLTSLVFRAGSVIVAEMLAVMQISYFSLAFLDSLNPVFSGLLPLRYLTGILNFQGVEQYLEETTSPNSMKGVYMFLNLSANFSYVALALAVFLALGGLLFLLHLFVDWLVNPSNLALQSVKQQQRKCYWLKKLAMHFVGELGLAMLLVCLPLFTVSLFFEVLYTQHSSNFWSYGEALGVGLGLVGYFVALIKSTYSGIGLGEFINEFQQVPLFRTLKYVNLQMLTGAIISGLVMATIYSNSKLFSTLCIIFVSFLDIVVVAVVKPYRWGFVSCFKGEDNHTEILFERIELYKVYDKAQPDTIRVDQHDATQKSEENENTSEVFAQHFATRKNIIKSKHQGLIQAGEVVSHSKLFLFNNNFRRIANLCTLIAVEFVFVCARIFSEEVNASYDTLALPTLLPLFIHSVLFLNVAYNYIILVLQIVNRTRQGGNGKVENEPDSSSQFMKSIYTEKRKEVKEKEKEEEQPTPVKSNKLILQTNANTKSMYDLKRPQILQPTRANNRREVKPKERNSDY